MVESVQKKVKEVALDLAPTMERIVKKSFPKAYMVADRFHVQQFASDGFNKPELPTDSKLLSKKIKK